MNPTTRAGTELDHAPDTQAMDLWRTLPAFHQPDWCDATRPGRVAGELARLPPLVTAEEVRSLRELLAEVAAGRLKVLQAGDCAEDPTECTVPHVLRKVGLLDGLAGAMRLASGRPVLRVGRIAGQFAKPRSAQTEHHNGVELPTFRGHMVNSPKPDPLARKPDSRRLLWGYWLASRVMRALNRSRWAAAPPAERVWTSHEALLLDYELPMLRRDGAGRLVLTSTHWPWIGDRTRQVDGTHVAMLAEVANPVACKVGPSMSAGELLALCEVLDPQRQPGRLTLIARMGADAVVEKLSPLVTAVRAAGHPVIWLCDPVHGNTVKRADGLKTRVVSTLVREVEGFQAAVATGGGVAGGLHLETTPDDVTECVDEESQLAEAGTVYTTLCDPRLNPSQALTVVSAWAGWMAR